MTKSEKSNGTLIFGVLAVLAILALGGYLILGDSGQTNVNINQPATASIAGGSVKEPDSNTGSGAQAAPAPLTYNSFPLGTLSVYMKDAANPTTAVVTSTVKGKVYTVDTLRSAIISPTTPYVDQDTAIDTSNGNLDFTGKKVQTNTKYQVKVWDSAASPTWYPVLFTVTVPAFDPSLGASAQYTAPDEMMQKVGTIADVMQDEAVGAGGGTIPTGSTSSHAYDNVTIDLSDSSALSTITLRLKLTMANTGGSTVLHNMVIKPMQDTTNPMPVTAFTAASMTYVDGTNLNIPGNVLPYISGQNEIPLGEWGDGVSAHYYLQVSLDEASLTAGNKFMFYVDDQGGYLKSDDIAGQNGAASKNFFIVVQA